MAQELLFIQPWSGHLLQKILSVATYGVTIHMKFEWDETKNRQNIRKHSFDLSDAQKLFAGVMPLLVGLDDRMDYGEERWKGIGVLGSVVVVVVFVERGEDTIRIISLRKAGLKERMGYEEEIKNRLAKSQGNEGSRD